MSLTCRWGSRKAAANATKHRVTFEEAQTAFADEAALVIADPDHSDDEDLFILLGLRNVARLLVVVHCVRDGGAILRIISARKATRGESPLYKRRAEP